MNHTNFLQPLLEEATTHLLNVTQLSALHETDLDSFATAEEDRLVGYESPLITGQKVAESGRRPSGAAS